LARPNLEIDPNALNFDPGMKRRNEANEWMWSQACDLIEQAERMHRQFFRLASSAGTEAVWEPPADVFEDEREIVIAIALPGVTADRVEVSADGDSLVVRAERPGPFGGARRAVRHLEIPYGYFERRIPLPAGPHEAYAQELSHGLLVVRIRKVSQVST
jgi:HSP20 family molecular chaperone IbpA